VTCSVCLVAEHPLNFSSCMRDCRYIATIDGAVSKRSAISEGTVIDSVHCTPDSVELLPQQPDISRPRLCIMVCILFLFSQLELFS
jgi:hypothetical protein